MSDKEDNDDIYDPSQAQDFADYNPESIDYEAAQDDDDAEYSAEESPEDSSYDTTKEAEEPPEEGPQRRASASHSPVVSRPPVGSLSPTATRQPDLPETAFNNNGGDSFRSPSAAFINDPYQSMSPPANAPSTETAQESTAPTSTLPKSVDLQALLAGLTPARAKVASPPQERDRPAASAAPPPSGNLPPDIMYQLSNLGSPTSQNAPQFQQPPQQQQTGPVDIQPQDLVLTPQEEQLFEKFIENEREIVSNARWDQFPPGSRMFIGNLPSERVTKRDIFRLFYPYGRLAQISIKQAYGFVQFYEREDCEAAIRAQQGMIITGRKVHLEVSKPQKPKEDRGRGAGARNRSPVGRDRDRSPGRGRGRNDRGFEQRGRQPSRDYSPPGRYRRDDYDDRRYSRSRSPPPARGHASPPPRGRQEPPEVALIVRDNADRYDPLAEYTDVRPYINYVVDLFEDRRIRTETIFPNPRTPIQELTKQLIIDGVVAVVFLSRQLQDRRKISMQTFQRNPADPGSVKWDEYNEIDFEPAVDLVLALKRGPVQPSYPTFPPQSGYGAPAPIAGLPAGVNPNLANIIGSLNPGDLQKLLGALAQQPPAPAPAYPAYPPQGAGAVGLSGLLGQPGLQGFGGQPAGAANPPAQQVQDIMAQLAALSKKS